MADNAIYFTSPGSIDERKIPNADVSSVATVIQALIGIVPPSSLFEFRDDKYLVRKDYLASYKAPPRSSDGRICVVITQDKNKKRRIDEVGNVAAEQFTCSSCEKNFSDVKSLVLHFNSFHNDTVAPPYPGTSDVEFELIDATGDVQKVLLYLREPAQQLYDVLSLNGHVLVEGPPGVGKSMVTWFWASRANKTVVWLYFYNNGLRGMSVIYNGKCQYISCTMLDPLFFVGLPPICVVVDGVTKEFGNHLTAAWSWGKQPHAQLILTASVQANIKPEVRQMEKMAHNIMFGWTLDEYKKAMTLASFKQKYPHLADEDDLEARFGVLGASARWMFGRQNDSEDALEYYLRHAPDTSALFKGFVGDRSDTAVNHLVTTTAEGASFVSKAVTIRLVLQHQLQFIQLAKEHQLQSNPTFRGWIFEAEVLLQFKRASEREKTIIISSKEDGSQKQELKVGKQYKFTDVNDLSTQTDPIDSPAYLVPLKWNQGCYDLVRFSGKTVQFIQITLAKTHSFKSKYAIQLLDALTARKFQFDKVELIILVPTLSEFRFSSTIDNLGEYKKKFVAEDGEKDCSIWYIKRL